MIEGDCDVCGMILRFVSYFESYPYSVALMGVTKPHLIQLKLIKHWVMLLEGLDSIDLGYHPY